MLTYSTFWLSYAAGTVQLAPIWASRDDELTRALAELCGVEMLAMEHWLALPEAKRAAVITGSKLRRSTVRFGSTKEQRYKNPAA